MRCPICEIGVFDFGGIEITTMTPFKCGTFGRSTGYRVEKVEHVHEWCLTEYLRGRPDEAAMTGVRLLETKKETTS